MTRGGLDNLTMWNILQFRNVAEYIMNLLKVTLLDVVLLIRHQYELIAFDQPSQHEGYQPSEGKLCRQDDLQ